MKRRIDGFLKGIPTNSDTLRDLYGVIRTSDGQLVANTTTTWGREQEGSLAQGLTLVPDTTFTVDTNAEGELQLQAMAGIYIVSFPYGGITHVFRVAVPDEEGPFNISSLVNGPWVESGNLSVFESIANKAKSWAEAPEDMPVEDGEFSSKHHRLKSEQAQALSEDARDASIVAQGLSEAAQAASEVARDASVVAQGLSEDAKAASELARDGSVAAQAVTEAARDVAVGAASAAATSEDNAEASAALAHADALATAADRVQTGEDRAAASVSASQAALYDGPWLGNVTTLIADTSLTYTGGSPSSVAAGDIIRTRAEGFSYEVAASAATDQHVTTAGGVKLYVFPGDEGYVAAAFGVDATGATNTTTSLKMFYDVCIASEKDGYVGPGVYLVTLGELAFDNGHADTTLPTIKTAGHFSVEYRAAANIDAAFLSFTNGTASSAVGSFWQGGGHGGVKFAPAAGSVAGLTGMHGLVLQGVNAARFGFMRGDGLGGDTIHIRRQLFGGTNPDPYNVSSCEFEGAEGNGNLGRAFMNDNYVGLTGCRIKYIRAIENVQGAFFGMGAGNTVDVMSVGSCGGWAVGDQANVTGGASSRFQLGTAEFDDVENGIDTRISSKSEFGIVRFVHRYNFGPLNPSGGYWPRTALHLADGARGVIGLTFNVIDRIEVGGTKPDLGVFANFGNAGGNLRDVVIRRQILDNASLGVSGTDLYANFNVNSSVLYLNSDIRLISTLYTAENAARVRAANASVLNGGFTGTGNTIAFNTLLRGTTLTYNTTTHTFTARGAGAYRIRARMVLTLAVGNLVRMAIMRNGSAATSRYRYAQTTNAEQYEIEDTLYLSPGDQITINADQNSGAAVNLSSFLLSDDNMLEILPV